MKARGVAITDGGFVDCFPGDEFMDSVFMKTHLSVDEAAGVVFYDCAFIGGNAETMLSKHFQNCQFYQSAAAAIEARR